MNSLMEWGDSVFIETNAKTIYKLGRKEPNKLLRLNIPSHVKAMVLLAFSEATFAKIKDDLILELFYDESDQIRKTAAILAVRAFTHKKLKSLLETYISSDSYRFYNVIHWLDLGVSLPRSVSKAVARKAML